MTGQAALLWRTLEFRAPVMLRAVESLTDAQLLWSPPRGGNSVAWLLWHIAEVEDNWVRDRLYGQAPRFPFGASVRHSAGGSYPAKAGLLDYFREVRSLSRERLAKTTDAALGSRVADEHFGELTAADVWIAVATSCSWHGGQIVMLANRIVPTEALGLEFFGIDHVQLAMPHGGEQRAREFYASVLGLAEVPKPAVLAVRGGAWFEAGDVRVHLGIEDDFRPAKKAHPAIAVSDLAELQRSLDAAGCVVRPGEPLESYPRLFTEDPFGNRLEFLERRR